MDIFQKKKEYKSRDVLVIIVALLLSVTFWLPAFLPNIQSLCACAFVMLAIYFGLTKNGRFAGEFRFPIVIFYAGILGAGISCYVYWGQTFYESSLRFFQFEMYLGGMYYLLKKMNPSVKSVENALLVLFFLSAAIFLFQNRMGETLVFGEISDDTRGTQVRVRIPGGLIFSLMFICSFVRYIQTQKIFYLPLLGISMISMLMQGFRTYLIGASICCGFYYIKRLKLNLRSMITSATLIGFIVILFNTSAGESVVNGMLARTTDQLAENNDQNDIRVQSFMYYVFTDKRDLAQVFLGSGFPIVKNAYGNHYANIQERWGLFRVDLGLLGYFMFGGVLTIIGVAVILYKSIQTKLHQHYEYISLFFMYIFLVSFSTVEFYRVGSFGFEGALLYLIDKTRVDDDT